MFKNEIVKRFCLLSTLVGGEKFKHFKAHDCFCEDSCSAPYDNFQFDEEVLAFIELAVKEKLTAAEVTLVKHNNVKCDRWSCISGCTC